MRTYKNNRNSKLRKSSLLLIGLSIFSVSLATSITATYAWYTISGKMHVNNLNLVIKSKANLALGLKGENGEIDYTEKAFTNYSLNTNQIELKDVSGMYESTWRQNETSETLPTFRAAYRGSGNVRDSREATFQEGYIQKEFYLKGTQDMDIFLTGGTKEDENRSFVEANETKNSVIAKNFVLQQGGNANDILKDLNHVVDATRISFYSYDGYTKKGNYVIAAPGNFKETYYGGVLDLNGDGYYDYNASNNKEILYGEYKEEVEIPYETNSGNEQDLGDEPESENTCFEAKHKPGVETVNVRSLIDGNLIQKEKAVPFESVTFARGEYNVDGKTPICHLKAREDTRLVVSIYLEGWDLRMTDKLSSASFDIRLNFMGLVK